MGKRPTKIPDDELLRLIREAVASGNYREAHHRRVENVGRPGHDVTRLEVEQVLLTGSREPSRDRFDPHPAWSYAMRGRTIDHRDLRVAVAIQGNLLFIVSVDAPAEGKRN